METGDSPLYSPEARTNDNPLVHKLRLYASIGVVVPFLISCTGIHQDAANSSSANLYETAQALKDQHPQADEIEEKLFPELPNFEDLELPQGCTYFTVEYGPQWYYVPHEWERPGTVLATIFVSDYTRELHNVPPSNPKTKEGYHFSYKMFALDQNTPKDEPFQMPLGTQVSFFSCDSKQSALDLLDFLIKEHDMFFGQVKVFGTGGTTDQKEEGYANSADGIILQELR